nr:MAG TPA: hypothetical protein [Caudoviricetes sp.]
MKVFSFIKNHFLVKPNQGYANGTVYGNWRENGEYGSAERIGMT